ncbi:NDR1/HIN1-like protein 1 [Momordica charantia]|uniref:NDR1/HIN1-like protein 1 n=1 Tax=Momordica charantia TaxID=3673 RepID=A0A6J1DGH3_MOMCH|nr:NDR1/HIN1-like protein 1 [Momordica charantia]
MSAKDKDCGHHDDDDYSQFLRRLAILVLGLIVIVGLVVLIVWAVLHPSKPNFMLQDVTVFGLNATSSPANLLSLSMQVTISSRNPNDRIGVYYTSMDVYGAYRGQQVTLPTLLPSTYQGHRDVVVWSPFLSGDAVPVAPDVALSLQQDRNVGALLFNVKIDGRVKWKVGSWISGRYHLIVNCPALIRYGKPGNAVAVGTATKFQIVQTCNVEV